MTSGLLARFFDSGSIFHPAYVLSAFAIALAWLLSQGRGVREALRLIFAQDAWLRRSTLIDLGFCAVYFGVIRLWVNELERLAFASALALAGPAAPAPGWLTLSPAVEAVLAMLVTMVSIDFASYAVHRGLHGYAPLWRIHRVHHSAERLTPLTTYRQHPLEPLILYGARGLASGLGLGALYLFLPRHEPLLAISGLGAGFFVYMFTVNLHHAPVPVHYPRWLRAVLVSPHIHHLHHSADERHHGANYGVVFSFWDRLWGTYLDESVEPGQLRFGLGTQDLPAAAATRTLGRLGLSRRLSRGLRLARGGTRQG